MSVSDFFDAARSLKRELTGERLSPADIDALNAIIAAWRKAPAFIDEERPRP